MSISHLLHKERCKLDSRSKDDDYVGDSILDPVFKLLGAFAIQPSPFHDRSLNSRDYREDIVCSTPRGRDSNPSMQHPGAMNALPPQNRILDKPSKQHPGAMNALPPRNRIQDTRNNLQVPSKRMDSKKGDRVRFFRKSPETLDCTPRGFDSSGSTEHPGVRILNGDVVLSGGDTALTPLDELDFLEEPVKEYISPPYGPLLTQDKVSSIPSQQIVHRFLDDALDSLELREREDSSDVCSIQRTRSAASQGSVWEQDPPPLPGWSEIQQKALIAALQLHPPGDMSEKEGAYWRQMMEVAHRVPGKSAQECSQGFRHLQSSRIIHFGPSRAKST